MPLPVFKSCCFGCSLRTGSLIIGYLGVVRFLILIVLAALRMAELSSLYGINESWRTHSIAMLAIFQILCGVQFVFYSILGVHKVLGVHKCNVRCLGVFIKWATVLLCLEAIGGVLNIISGATATGVGNLIGTLLLAYFILIVRSFYLDQLRIRMGTLVGQPGYPAQPGFGA